MPSKTFKDIPEDEKLLTALEVASLFKVSRRTIEIWTKLGYITHFKTPGGHLRFPVPAVKELMAKDLFISEK